MEQLREPLNHLLARLDAADLALLAPHLERVPIKRLDTLAPRNAPIERVFFPEGAIVSIVAVGPNDSQTEIGIFGREGMSGVAVLLGTVQTPHDTYVQVDSSTALALSTAALLQACERSATLRTVLLRFAHVQSVQVAGAVSALATSTVDRRLARWLLMCHDRIDRDVLPITHEFLGMMLGTRRAGVTEALHMLEGERLVRADRGRVTVLDRAGLEALAGASYGAAEAEYRRLIGPLPRDLSMAA